MSDSLLNRIKKFIAKVENESSQETNDNSQIGQEVVSDKIIESSESDTDNSPQNDKTLVYSLDEKLSSDLKYFFSVDSNVLYSCIINKKDLSVKGFYSTNKLTDEYIYLLVETLISTSANIQLFETDNTIIEKLLVVSDDIYQYIVTDTEYIILLITNQTNQLISWRLLDKLKNSFCINN